MKRKLEGKTAIITGASRGIGEAVARLLAKSEMNLALLARSEDQLNALTSEIESETSATAHAFSCDLSDLDALPGVAQSIVSRLGQVDILVNNAGTFLECPLAETPTEAWQHTLNVNLTAVFILCRELIPHLIKSKGRIVNIVSTSGSQGYLNQSAYCGSKHGLLGMSRALAIELKPEGIQVNCISPGGVETNFIKGTYLGERLQGQVMIQPEDVAETVLHVLQSPGNVEIPEIVMKRFNP